MISLSNVLGITGSRRAILAVAALLLCSASQDHAGKAGSLLKSTPLIDGHNDLPWRLHEKRNGNLNEFPFRRLSGADLAMFHTDLARLRTGRVGAQFWSVYVPSELSDQDAVRQTLEQIDIVHRLIDLYPRDLAFARTAADVRRAFKQGRIASLMGAEGGHSIGNSPAILRQLHRLGVRYLGLTHSKTTDWADSATDAPRHGGLSSFGLAVVREMNRLGMLVDLSHASAETMKDAIGASSAPVIFSHSSAAALVPHARNVPDDVLRMLPTNHGVVMVTFVPPFVSADALRRGQAYQAEDKRLRALYPAEAERREAEMKRWVDQNPAPEATLEQVADHIDHIRKVAGIDHVGIGSDFDGFASPPRGLEDVSRFPALFTELLRRGYTADEVRKIAGENILRVMRLAEVEAARLQRLPSTAALQRAASP
jgi:membrane dipeptidase